MKFNYQARNREGRVQSGTVEASSKEAALDVLQKYGLFVTFVEEESAPPFYARRVKFLERVSVRDIVMFARQLAIMFKSQIPLVEALEVLALQTANPQLKETILKIGEEVESGVNFSRALSRHPKLFSPFFISMVKSGEASGKLSESLTYLAEHLERDYHLRSTVRGAFIYPAFLLAVLLVVAILMLFLVMPTITELLKEAGEGLPWMTQVTMAVTDFLRGKGGWVVIAAVIALVGFAWWYSRTKDGKEFFDRNLIRVPMLSGLLRKVYLSRFAENLSTLIAGGLPIARALEITGEVVGNYTYRAIIMETRDRVRKGENISNVLKRYPEDFPPLFIQMIIVGERTGRLDTALLNVVEFYQKEVDRSVNNFIKFLEPVLIIILGLAVAFFVISVLMPLYQVYQTGAEGT